MEINRHQLLSNKQLTPVGRHLLLTELQKKHTVVKQVLNYMATATNAASQNLSIDSPLIIVSLPRTGSTLLYSLLACDPNCRVPLVMDIDGDCVPPISRSNTIEQERRNGVLALVEQQYLEYFGRPLIDPQCHPVVTIEEDTAILRHTGVYYHIQAVCPGTEIDDWFYDETNKDFAYAYHKTFLRMLNSVDAPSSHWLLKAPIHSLYLDTLTRYYPRASLIMTHRRLDEVIPSFYSYVSKIKDCCLDKTNAMFENVIMTQTIENVDKLLGTEADRIVKFRNRVHDLKNESKIDIFDILYDDLVDQPITIVRRIYDHFGLTWSDEFETAMKTWLRENPQGKYGRHTYDLSKYGVTPESIETRYADYINMFLRSSSESSPNSVNNHELPSTIN
jgi:hypothetical protein